MRKKSCERRFDLADEQRRAEYELDAVQVNTNGLCIVILRVLKCVFYCVIVCRGQQMFGLTFLAHSNDTNYQAPKKVYYRL